MPPYIVLLSTTVFSRTTEPAAMMEFDLMTALSITIAPMPMSTLSSIVHPCTIALWPIETKLPIVVGDF